MKKTIWLGVALVVFHVLSVYTSPVVNASSAASFSPPSSITVKMYQLEDWGESKGVTCSDGRDKWGCTAYCRGSTMCNTTRSDLYPFSSEYATVAIEGQGCSPDSNPYNCYLLDVVSQEMGSYYHPVALDAQAVAARTYAYFFFDNGVPIANSATYQAFVPFRYHALGSSSDTLNAIARRLYLSNSATDRPIRAEFTADVYGTTRTNPSYPAYLLGVAEPISTACDANDDGVNLAGMSSEGASRWARGHECSYAGAAVLSGNAPGGAWSVKWLDSFRILVHYYTGIHVRDAANGSVVLTPNRRLNVLQASINNAAPNQGDCSSDSFPVHVTLQNTGTQTWYGASTPWYYGYGRTGYGYCWGSSCRFGGELSGGQVSPGSTSDVTLNVPRGAGKLSIDLYYQPYEGGPRRWFGAGIDNDFPWPWQTLMQCALTPTWHYKQ